MSEPDVSAMSSDDLVNAFIAGATNLGSVVGWLRSEQAPAQTPQRQALVARQHAISAELCRRASIEKIRPLYEHGNPDVRHWAATRFAKIDPEWSEAASDAVWNNMSTAEVLGLRRQARTRPPERPTLPEMTVDELVERFEDACMRRHAARFLHDRDDEMGGPDIETKNRIAAEILQIVAEIKARDALPRLTPFIDSAVDSVRYNAAAHCLPIATERAISVLKQFDEDKSNEHHMDAWTILGKWQRGTYGTAKW